jgi:hypothetical protein
MDKNEEYLSFFAQRPSWAKSAIAGPSSLISYAVTSSESNPALAAIAAGPSARGASPGWKQTKSSAILAFVPKIKRPKEAVVSKKTEVSYEL